MSIIERYSPLNLAYKVAIVTNASSPLGVVVCKTLLKSNALVLGVDDKPKDDSLNDGVYSHFQFHQCDLTNESSAGDIIEYAKSKYKVERLNALVNLASADDDEKLQNAHKKLALACAEAMKKNGGGSIVNSVLEAADDGADVTKTAERLVSSTKDLATNTDKSVRCNMIIPAGAKNDAKPSDKFESAKSHLDFLFRTKSTAQHIAGTTIPPKDLGKLFDFSNMALFLSSEMSEGINGTVFTATGGSYTA